MRARWRTCWRSWSGEDGNINLKQRKLLAELLLSRAFGSGTQKMADKNLASAPLPNAGVHVAACVSNPVPLQKLAADKEGLSQAVKKFIFPVHRSAEKK